MTFRKRAAVCAAAALLMTGCGTSAETTETATAGAATEPAPTSATEDAVEAEPAEETEPVTSSEAASVDESPAPAAAAASAQCDAAFAEAATVNEFQDTLEDLWPAFEACADLDEFTAASEQHPGVLEDADPELYVQNQCDFEPAVADSPLCASRP